MAKLRPERDVIMSTLHERDPMCAGVCSTPHAHHLEDADAILKALKDEGYLIVPEALRPYTNWRTLAGLARSKKAWGTAEEHYQAGYAAALKEVHRKITGES